MRKDIVAWVQEACQKFGLEAYFMPDTQVYVITKVGRAIQNFNIEQFYQIPRLQRMREYRALLRQGLMHNLGEKAHDNLYMPRKFGIRVWPRKKTMGK